MSARELADADLPLLEHLLEDLLASGLDEGLARPGTDHTPIFPRAT
jgi:hypothetical protein